jgi:HTH-type transcriptional regulator / antitoxin HigA
MKTPVNTRGAGAETFDRLPKDYLGLCQRYVPRPLHRAAAYAAACLAIEPLVGFEDQLTADQVDYLEAVSSFLEAYDRTTVKWPKGKPLDILRFLIEQRGMTGADLSRLWGTDRSLGPKILRGERRLTVDHIRILARHFQVEPGLFL